MDAVKYFHQRPPTASARQTHARRAPFVSRKKLKRVSNLWLKERGRDCADFEWQGDADFSVRQSNLEQVKQYIARQEEPHRKIGFQDELRALLRKHEIEWDEKYGRD